MIVGVLLALLVMGGGAWKLYQFWRRLQQIPALEASLLWDFHILRRSRLQMADKRGVTRAAVWYRLERGQQRLDYLKESS